MPIYEYACDQCGHKFEALQKMTDAKLTNCPACQQSSLRKLVSAAGFQLKGTGWYATDFKGNKTSSVGSSSTNSSTPAPAATSSEPSAAAPAPAATGCGSGGCGHKH